MCIVLGDPRSNQNPALLSFGILLFKWHNELANRVQLEHPDWSDEEVFQKARRFVVATLQVFNTPQYANHYLYNYKLINGLLNIYRFRVLYLLFTFVFQNIIAYEYIPAFLGTELPEYTGYKLDVHPGISHVFQSSAFRFGHTMIPPGIYRRDGKCNYRKTAMGNPALRLCAYWWDSSVSIYTINEQCK